VGVIASVTEPFCGACSRARLSAEGVVYTCLFATHGTDLRTLLREGAGSESLDEAVHDLWAGRTDRYSEIRSSLTAGLNKVEMSHIGG
jgi:cyclic pyranopterin phosphate synthase